MQYCLNYSGTRFLSTEIKVTQFADGFCFNNVSKERQAIHWC